MNSSRHEIHTWLARSGVVRDKATELNDKAQLRLKWMYGFSYFLSTRRYKEKIGTIDVVLDERRALGSTVSDVVVIPIRNQTEYKIIEALNDYEISLVVIHGMPGIGKTVLLNSLHQHFKREQSFDHVVSLVISKHPDLRRIQDDLASQLNLQLNEQESTNLKAKRLLKKFNEGDDKLLILFNDLWDKIDLAPLGIPCKNCKIVFTTRSLTVCDSMNAQSRFLVEAFIEEDSLRLFKSNAGDAPDPAVAEQIVKECKGVPLAIAILGRALRGKGRAHWIKALQPFQSLSFRGTNIDPISAATQVSYNFLPSETTRMCFLFCCLFPEDFKIPCTTLLSYVVGEKLIQNVDTLEEIRNSLNAIVEKLTSLALLLRLDEDWVMMHDIVRDEAIQIGTQRKNQFIVKAGIGLTMWPTMSLNECMRLSLMHNKLGVRRGIGIPTQINAPQLSTLSLHGNKDLKEIPQEFFRKMNGLLTLDLSETCIASLPLSLACLVNLRTLCLDRCYYLENITPVGRLGNLEILTLSETQMRRLPEQIRRLNALKLLDLSKAPNLVTIPRGVISNLSQLQELNMKDSFSQWEIDPPGDGLQELNMQYGFRHWEVEDSWDGRNATLSEIATLKHLASLKLCVANLDCLSQEMLQHWESLKQFEILLGSIVSFSSP